MIELKNVTIWNVISVLKENTERISEVTFFEYDGDFQVSKILNSWKLKYYGMTLDFLSQIMLAVYGHIKDFNVQIFIHGSDISINIKLLNRKDD